MDMSPAPRKLIASSVLPLAALIPSDALHRVVYDLLMWPLPFLRFYPLVFKDKNWFVTHLGAVVIGVFWGSVIYLLCSIKRGKGPTPAPR